MCLNQHHVVEEKLLAFRNEWLPVGLQLLPKESLQRGRVCIFVRTDQHFCKIDCSLRRKEQDFQICAIQLVIKHLTYRTGINIFRNLPSGFKSLMNHRAQFKLAVKHCLNANSFFSVND
jgi:hypothetical protein